MRTDALIPPEPKTTNAGRAPGGAPGAKRDRASAMLAFGPLLSPRDDAGIGPEGIASQASRQVNDPLGLANERALASPASAAVAERTPALEQRTEPGGEAANGSRRGAETTHRPAPTPTQSEATEPRAPGPDRAARGSAPRPDPRPDPTPEPSAQVEPTRADRAGLQALAGRANAPAQGRGGEAAGAVRAVPGTVSAPASAGSSGHAGGRGATLPGSVSPTPVATKDAPASGAREAPFRHVLRGEQAGVAPQVAKGLASLLMRKGGSVQIQLRPEALGRVRVDLTMLDGVVSARLDAETEAARRLLGSDIERLRTMLEQRGLRVERLEVTSGQAERDGSAHRNGDQGGGHSPAEDARGRDGQHAGRDAGDQPGGRDAEHGEPRSGGRGPGDEWGGVPEARAERGPPTDGPVRTAESGGPGVGVIDLSAWRSPGAVSVRLDAMA